MSDTLGYALAAVCVVSAVTWAYCRGHMDGWAALQVRVKTHLREQGALRREDAEP